MDERWLRRAGLLGFVASIGLIAYGTLSSSPAGSNTPDWLAHFLMFAALGGTAVFAFARGERPWTGLLLAIAIALAFGALTEVAQGATATRSPSLRDWVADVAGGATGAAVAYALLRALTRRD